MDAYVRQRPDLKSLTPALYNKWPDYPEGQVLANWQSQDGSRVLDFHLPAEYTAWFEDKLLRSVNLSIDAAGSEGKMACFFGVGNHGGGPTKQNIEHVISYSEYTRPDGLAAKLCFSRLDTYLSGVDRSRLPEESGEFQGPDSGCYASDTQLKRDMKQAEEAQIGRAHV